MDDLTAMTTAIAPTTMSRVRQAKKASRFNLSLEHFGLDDFGLSVAANSWSNLGRSVDCLDVIVPNRPSLFVTEGSRRKIQDNFSFWPVNFLRGEITITHLVALLHFLINVQPQRLHFCL